VAKVRAFAWERRMLEYMVRMRRYRKRATASHVLAATSLASDVRDRYFVIANHYSDLANVEEQNFKVQLEERFNGGAAALRPDRL